MRQTLLTRRQLEYARVLPYWLPLPVQLGTNEEAIIFITGNFDVHRSTSVVLIHFVVNSRFCASSCRRLFSAE